METDAKQKASVRRRADEIKPFRCKNLIAVIEDPHDVKNIRSIIRNVNALGVEKAYIVDPKRTLSLSRTASRTNSSCMLLRAVEHWAAAHHYAEVTLTTFLDVPWNGPFYRRLGYAVVPPEDLDPEFVGRREAKAACGMDSMPRVAMRKSIGRPKPEAAHRRTGITGD